MIQIWKPKHSATVIRLDSVFAHGDGLPCRRIGTTANRLGDASIRRVWTGRVLSAIAFYEKVIKVKADVAAYLINCFPSP
jgi:hypothetical protein